MVQMIMRGMSSSHDQEGQPLWLCGRPPLERQNDERKMMTLTVHYEIFSRIEKQNLDSGRAMIHCINSSTPEYLKATLFRLRSNDKTICRMLISRQVEEYTSFSCVVSNGSAAS